MEAARAAVAEAAHRLAPGAGLAEVFLEDRCILELTLGPEGPGRSERRLRGACLRRVGGDRTMAVHRDDPSAAGLGALAEDLLHDRVGVRADAHPPLVLPAASLPEAEETALTGWVRELGEGLRSLSPTTQITLTRWRQAILVAGAEEEGPSLVDDLRDGLQVEAVLTLPTGRERWSAAGTGAGDLPGRCPPARVREEVERRMADRTEACPAPEGRFPVVFAPAAAGVLVHEVFGHPLEADAAGSWLDGRVTLPEDLSLVDEPGRARGAGGYRIDDEGIPGRPVVLVARGEVRARLRDRVSARLAGVEPTGHGRRQSYRELPSPRLACTVLEAGEVAPEDLVEEVVRGLLVERIAGGTVDPVSGSLCLLVEAARLIEGGRPTRPVQGAVLFGEARSWLEGPCGVGNDLRLDHGATACSKGGQTIPVIVGAPSLALASVPVGGRGGA
jgi:TldD protein